MTELIFYTITIQLAQLTAHLNYQKLKRLFQGLDLAI